MSRSKKQDVSEVPQVLADLAPLLDVARMALLEWVRRENLRVMREAVHRNRTERYNIRDDLIKTFGRAYIDGTERAELMQIRRPRMVDEID